MAIRRWVRTLLIVSLSLSIWSAAWAQGGAAAPAQNKNAELQFAVILSRHGIRSPNNTPERYAAYAAAPWPKWKVPLGYLTPHGYKLMTLFGAYYRSELSEEGLLAPSGCADAAHVTILADHGERTIKTGEALGRGMFPGCGIQVHTVHRSVDQHPMVHEAQNSAQNSDDALAAAAVSGRIGGNANNLTEALRPQLAALDNVLAGCGHAGRTARKRTSIFDIPASLPPGSGSHPLDLRGPVIDSSEITENLLLEYVQGMAGKNLGWGCLTLGNLREILQLRTAGWEINERTPVIARIESSNLLAHILEALEQSATGRPVAGAPGKPGDRLLVLVGHDSNIANVGGMLGLNWIADGLVDPTPPGGALVFELWRSRMNGKLFVRIYFTTQTMDQMRETQTLTLAHPPARVPIFDPECGRQDLSCAWDAFAASTRQSINPRYVKQRLSF